MSDLQKLSYQEIRKFYNSSYWRKLRTIKINNSPFCERCKKGGVVTVGKEVHHIKPLKFYPERGLSYENLRTLCRRCHSKIEGALKKILFKDKKAFEIETSELWKI